MHRGELEPRPALEQLARIRELPIRLLGDAVLRRRAWDIAEQLGWADTYDAEYVALTQLQADAFVTLDAKLARRLGGIVATATIDALRTGLRESSQDLDELAALVSLLPCELEQLRRFRQDHALLRGPGDGDAAPTPELEEAFGAQDTQGAEDGVRVHAEDRCEITGGRKSLAWPCLAFGDRPADGCGDLKVQVARVIAAEFDALQWC